MGWIQTNSGKTVDPCSFRLEDVDLSDIAHALARIGRFNGHTREFYSVAQHSVLASCFVHVEWGKLYLSSANAPSLLDAQRWALLHDAHEAYLGDIPRPLRHMVFELDVKKSQIDARIAQVVGMLADKDGSVHAIDEVLLATEKRDLMAVQIEWPGLKAEPIEGYQISPWSVSVAECAFRKRYAELWKAQVMGHTPGVGDRAIDALIGWD